MKILHFTWDTPIPGVGGSTHEWNIAYAFKKLGNNIKIVCEKRDKKIKNEEIINNIKVSRIFWRNKKLLLPFIAFYKSIIEILKFNPELIYERYRIFGGYGIIIGKLFGKKTILEVNDPTIDAPYIEKRINLFIKLLAVLWEKLVFFCSNKIVTHHKIMVKRADVKKTQIITNGVNTKKFNINNFKRKKWKNKFVCLFVGTFCEWQGFNTIIKTAKSLENNKEILFIFAGGKIKNTKNTLFLGKIEYNKIPELIAQSDICLYLPDTENYKPMKELGFYFSPLKIFEYMSMRKPIITSDVGNIKKLIKNNINGFRIKPNNEESLKNKILYLKKKTNLIKRIGNNNRIECIKKYDWINIAKKILKGI